MAPKAGAPPKTGALPNAEVDVAGWLNIPDVAFETTGVTPNTEFDAGFCTVAGLAKTFVLVDVPPKIDVWPTWGLNKELPGCAVVAEKAPGCPKVAEDPAVVPPKIDCPAVTVAPPNIEDVPEIFKII